MAQGRDDLYNEILRNGPSPGTILLVLSELKKDGQLKQAIQECIKALSVHPHDVSIRRLLAETYFEAGLITQAEAELETVTAGIGDLSAAYKLQAEIYSQQRREEEAAKALKIYLVHRPDDQEAHHLLEALEAVEEAPVEQAQAEVEQISPPLQEAVEEVPPTPEEQELPEIATPTLAEIYLDQGQLQQAINTYEKVVAQDSAAEASKRRLEELNRMMASEKGLADEGAELIRQKKKMISVLEAWLADIQEMSKGTVSP